MLSALHSPAGVVAQLLVLVAAVQALAMQPRTRRLFALLPPLLWIYLLPTLAAAAGLLPGKSPVYGALVEHLLPASLALLLVGVDLPAVLSLGPLALSTLGLSSAGILLGGPLVTLVMSPWLPADAWAGLGALGASWMGGSANMVAVKASLGTPEAVFAQVVIVDVVAAYSWMALLLFMARHQAPMDRWTRARGGALSRLVRAPAELAARATARLRADHTLLLLGFGAACSALCNSAARVLPAVPGVISTTTWAILMVTALALGLSFTPARRLDQVGASRLGNLCLYLVLASIGARADLGALGRAPAMVGAGALWLGFHGLLLLVAGRLLRVPVALLATASQANIGGPVSAPLVASAYNPGLAGVGLLMAILGGVAGTYLGLVCGWLCKLAA